MVVSFTKCGALMFHFAVFLNIFMFWKLISQTRSVKPLTVCYKAYFEGKLNHNTKVWFAAFGKVYVNHN